MVEACRGVGGLPDDRSRLSALPREEGLFGTYRQNRRFKLSVIARLDRSIQ
jgi:hypothetical protein